MKKIILGGLSLLLMLTACKKDSNHPGTPVVNNNLNLSNLKVGQQSRYINYRTTCENFDTDFQFPGDTLLLEVVEINGALHLQEDITSNSPLRLNQQFAAPQTYPVIKTEHYILLKERSNSMLFSFYGNDTIWLQPKTDVVLVQNDCRLEIESNPFIGNEIGHTEEFKVGPLMHQNKTVVSCVPSSYQVDAYLIYSPSHLHMSHRIAGAFWEEPTVTGWSLLQN